MSDTRPTAVTADRQSNKVTITWEDGHTSTYSFSLLRHACPCAECRGGHANMSAEPEPGVFWIADEDTPATHLRDIQVVGTYAITPEWEDGHRYGIYTWRYLRLLCPCEECRSKG